MINLRILPGEDVRGSGAVIYLAGNQFFIFEIKKGFYRGGDYHPSNQHTICLSGCIEIKIKRREGEEIKTLLPGEQIVIPKNCPHLFFAKRRFLLSRMERRKG